MVLRKKKIGYRQGVLFDAPVYRYWIFKNRSIPKRDIFCVERVDLCLESYKAGVVLYLKMILVEFMELLY